MAIVGRTRTTTLTINTRHTTIRTEIPDILVSFRPKQIHVLLTTFNRLRRMTTGELLLLLTTRHAEGGTSAYGIRETELLKTHDIQIECTVSIVSVELHLTDYRRDEEPQHSHCESVSHLHFDVAASRCVVLHPMQHDIIFRTSTTSSAPVFALVTYGFRQRSP